MMEMDSVTWLKLAVQLWQGAMVGSARFQGALHATIETARRRAQYQNDPESDFGKKQKVNIENALAAVFGG